MDPIYLQIESDIDAWIGKTSILLPQNESLRRLWETSRPITMTNPYYPVGANSLRRVMQTSSPFRLYPEVQQLVLSRFDPADGDIHTVSDVEQFVTDINGIKTPKIVRVFVEEIYRWIGTQLLFGNGYLLKDMWDRHHGNAYADYGAPKLVNTLQTSANYASCPLVRTLDTGFFVGGGLKLVGDLRGYIRPCQLPPTP